MACAVSGVGIRLGGVSTALYRRYRPETFDEVIGQEHVTDPLKAAIERGRINHAYLFSGPRGCGKTTSARILARCLNCAQGPTPVPCGECPSCEDLANGGPGSLDVVEIDAASHNGVDDARDLRERAIYAPARDRFKVFILDEAHMVTSQGFNALLKIVEEPPPHIKFIFATTEPEKVIGTIRSRTHHYPFRLVPPEALGNYMEELCGREGVQVAKGVLPLVVRAGGGSVRDTLSVLDQLIAGSGPAGVDYAGAIALLGYTPDSLLSDIVDAFSAGDGGGVYRAVERVIESGQDPRRFVEDLLERMRDLIVINAAPEAAHAFLPEVPPDRLERLTLQARGFGQGELSRAADLLNQGLTEMSGATSPRLQLELMCARILLPGSGRSRDAVLSRVERMERRIGMSASGTAANIPPAPADSGHAEPVQASQGQAQPSQGQAQPTNQAADDDFDDLAKMAVAAESMLNEPPRSAPAPEARDASEGRAPQAPAPREPRVEEQAPQRQVPQEPRTQEANAPAHASAPILAPESEAAPEAAAPEDDSAAGGGNIGSEIDAIRRAWPSILAAVEKRSRLTRAIIAANAIPQSFSDGVLYLGFNNAGSVHGFQQRDHAAKLAMAINDVLGIQARIDIGDVGRIAGNSGQASSSGQSEPAHGPGGKGGPAAPAQRRPSPQEVAAVVGTREVDKPQVDHEKFWETSGSAEGPWSDDDEEGEPSADPTPQPQIDSGPSAESPATELSSPGEDEPSSAEEGPASTENAAVIEEPIASEKSASNEDENDVDIVVPDLSDDDFYAAPDESAPAESAPVERAPAEREPESEEPMEYAQPRWEEPAWHDGPTSSAPNFEDPSSFEASPDPDSTSAGSGAVEVGALVVPPPEDDDLDFLGDYSEADMGLPQSQPQAPHSAQPPQPQGGNGGAKPFKSRFAALAEKHGATAPPSPNAAGGQGYPSTENGSFAGNGADAGQAVGQPRNSGADEDEYDPETDLDVSEAPQIGVAVVARVLGGEIIDEREV